MATVSVIGGGLAGSECALQLAALGHRVRLYEMRPHTMTPVHKSEDLAELVCSNSFKSKELTGASGLLKDELRKLGSFLLDCAYTHAVPAGKALAVDRIAFSKAVSERVRQNPRIELVKEEVKTLPDVPCVVATGPVSSKPIIDVLFQELGLNPHKKESGLAFYDAVAPIVDAETITYAHTFAQSRYGIEQDGDDAGDYLNIALSKEAYLRFVDELVHGKKAMQHAFEKRELFSACQPIEEIARSGVDALRFGPLKPKGICDPRTHKEPYAVVQLRKENKEGSAYNLVGFQTNLKFSEQKRIFSTLPGLEQATFFRYGVLHKNTFIDAPRLTHGYFEANAQNLLFFAGQITGTEGYTEAIATGLVVARTLDMRLSNLPVAPLPNTTALGSLLAYAQDPYVKNYQPMHVNFGLLPPLSKRLPKKKRYLAYIERAQADMDAFLEKHPEWKGSA